MRCIAPLTSADAAGVPMYVGRCGRRPVYGDAPNRMLRLRPGLTLCRGRKLRHRAGRGVRGPGGVPELSKKDVYKSSGIALVHLISSRQTLERTPLTPGIRISVSSRKSDSDFRSRATTFNT